MTHMHTKDQGQRSVGLNRNRQTDGRRRRLHYPPANVVANSCLTRTAVTFQYFNSFRHISFSITVKIFQYPFYMYIFASLSLIKLIFMLHEIKQSLFNHFYVILKL